MNAPATGIINIHGKEYHTVAKRVSDFRAIEGHAYGIWTDVIQNDELVVIAARIVDKETGFTVAMGHAEERRGTSQINKTSALENCETSAIGRALAAFGIGGTEFASANEVQNAIHQQQEGQSQGDDHGKVSPPAFPDGPARNITALRQMQSDLWSAVEDAVDADALEAICSNEDNRRIFSQLARLENRKHRELWDGDGADNPGLCGLIQQRKEALNPNILQAG